MTTLADKINKHLEDGGSVQVATCTQSTIYGPKHAGWFTACKGSLHVRHGRKTNKLSFGNHLGVAIRFSVVA